jgi:hypothetical protein
MKTCRSCRKQIDEKARKCPYCRADQRNWFLRHKVWTVIIVLVVLGSLGSSSKKNRAAVTLQFDPNVFYLEIQNGNTKAQVVDLAGKNPSVCTQGEIALLGNGEWCRWNGGWGSRAFVDVYFYQDQVVRKQKTGF